jgi:hypothetical protein
MKKSLICLIALCSPLHAQTGGDLLRNALAPLWPVRQATQGPYDVKVVAHAQADECFVGLGQPSPGTPPCAQGRPKVDDAYVWGMTAVDDVVYFGTASNVLCGSGNASLTSGTQNIPFAGGPTLSSVKVCEKDLSQYSAHVERGFPGDWRPPHIYRYDPAGGLAEITPDDSLIQRTVGLRAAGHSGGVVLLAGPAVVSPTTPQPAVNVFAFDAASGAFLGSKAMPEAADIRAMQQVGDDLYVGVLRSSGGGSVLRWTGSAANPFQFQEVGTLPAQAASFAVHEGRLFVGTWPPPRPERYSAGEMPPVAGIYMSRPLDQGPLSEADRDQWQEVWKVTDYEPDPVTAMVYAIGAMASFDGHLYWGTLNLPFMGYAAHLITYGFAPEDLAAAPLNTFRAASLLRGRDFGGPAPKVEVVYGFDKAQVFIPQGTEQLNDRTVTTGIWQEQPNNTGKPLYGDAGFGTISNAYIWSMGVYENKLFIGTMDTSFNTRVIMQTIPATILARVVGLDLFEPANLHPPVMTLLRLRGDGADVYVMNASDQPARAMTKMAFGQYSTTGIRTMVTTPSGLYMGTANSFNLLGDPEGRVPMGGWGLWQVTENN